MTRAFRIYDDIHHEQTEQVTRTIKAPLSQIHPETWQKN